MQLHPVQRKILFDLLFSKDLRYSDVKPLEMDSSQFLFHLKQLIKEEYVEKQGSGQYALTLKGKEFANRLDVSSLDFAIQAKTTTILCCVRKNEQSGASEFLLYKRLKNPYFGCYGFPTQKVLFGQKLTEAVSEGMEEEASLQLKEEPQLFAVRHYLVLGNESEVLEDKFMYAYLILNPQGVLQSSNEGEYFWMDSVSAAKLSPVQDEFPDIFSSLNAFFADKTLTFKEVSVQSKNF